MTGRGTRRSQSVVPFGIGAIVEFEDEALMPAGLDAWPAEAERISDIRLARRLNVDHFRVPPPKPDRNGVPGTMAPLPYVRFPRWHFCDRCRALKRADLYARDRPRCDNIERSPRLGTKQPCGSLPESRRPKMLPLRFVAVCSAGHIDDFPWNEWAHTPPGNDIVRGRGCTPDLLYFYATRVAGLSGLMVACGKCPSKRSLMGVTSPGGLRGYSCTGDRPWLGKDSSEVCSAPPVNGRQNTMVAIQRGASNLYFPEVASSILIPPFSSRVHNVLRERVVWDHLTSSRVDGVVPEDVFKTIARLRNVDLAQLKEAFRNAIDDDSAPTNLALDETRFRHTEFQALQQHRCEKDDLLSCKPQLIDDYKPIVRDFFEGVTLVERLAETRALTGFHRLSPGLCPPSRLSIADARWLPAFRVHGEGIFLMLSREKLRHAASDTSRVERIVESARASGRFSLTISSELVLLHTLAHLLVKRLSFEAGYGASSIRERIYSAPLDSDTAMAGLLLYTAAGDADGTLGGLVGLGRAGVLERVVAGALEDARWCAADPICYESRGQGPESLNLAACHACALLPETSCELQNRILDRGSVLRFFGQA